MPIGAQDYPPLDAQESFPIIVQESCNAGDRSLEFCKAVQFAATNEPPCQSWTYKSVRYTPTLFRSVMVHRHLTVVYKNWCIMVFQSTNIILCLHRYLPPSELTSLHHCPCSLRLAFRISNTLFCFCFSFGVFGPHPVVNRVCSWHTRGNQG